jgi:hypothetical protein
MRYNKREIKIKQDKLIKVVTVFKVVEGNLKEESTEE